MLFHSIEFAIFLPTVFILYWFVINKNLKSQNLLLLIASYFFYGCWDWRFLFLILISSIIDYGVGLKLTKMNSQKGRIGLLLVSLAVNLGMLGFFKYYNFFISSFVNTFTFLGYPIPSHSLNIILPVGISFYTFQTLSYTIDIYRKKIIPTRDPIAFFAFVAFFPQLVAGPIERASNLLPQFKRNRIFDYDRAVDGCRQILWGLFKKVIIADSCAVLVNDIFSNSEILPGSVLLLGSIYFAFQIYGDFSGYSDIAIGTARLFGFSLMQNFAYPFFSRDIAELWRRWHISLSTWFRDYLYIPLGGSRGSKWMIVRNTLIVFIVSGFWHGAAWNYILWGVAHGLIFMPYILFNKNREHLDIVAQNSPLPSIKEFFQMSNTFLLFCFTFIIFRAENVGHAFSYIRGIFSPSIIVIPQMRQMSFLGILTLFILFEWAQRRKKYALEKRHHAPSASHAKQENLISQLGAWVTFILLGFISILAINSNPNAFIYFQF